MVVVPVLWKDVSLCSLIGYVGGRRFRGNEVRL